MIFTVKTNGKNVRFGIRTYMTSEVRNITLEELKNLFFSPKQLFANGEIDGYLVTKQLIIKPEEGKSFSMDLLEERRESDDGSEEDKVKVTSMLNDSPLNVWINENNLEGIKEIMRKVMELYTEVPGVLFEDKSTTKTESKVTRPETIH